MAQVQTFPFSNLITPPDGRVSRLSVVDSPSNTSVDSSLPQPKVKTYYGSLYQEVQSWQPDQYYGPEFVNTLSVTSSVNLFGDPLTLSVEVRGNPISSFSYTWYKNGSPLITDAVRTVTNTPSGSILSISGITYLDDHSIYSLRVYNPYNDPIGINNYAETSTFINVVEDLYHPTILFISVGAIQ